MQSSPQGAPRRRTQVERRAATETALLEAAADVIVEAGVGALTLARVGSRAGYSRGIVTHHYGSKLALLEAVVRNAQNGIISSRTSPPG
jgi:AcrR family transcriptional regulator